ncbi:B-cell lymphoma 3 protein isoform X2 [Athene noctua]|uniref:B-cell lymphoma 3 protein isoform X2 n=1 Tax=Athene noctua TaxID=126797 RepID=UPI003EBF1B68
MAEELPVDLRTRRGAPPGPGPPEASLPLRKRRSAMQGAMEGPPPALGPPPGKAPRGAPPAPPPAACPPPGLGLGFHPPPAAFFSGLRGELPLPLGGGSGAGLAAPPAVLAFPPAHLALLGPPETQLAADIAAATGQDEDGDTALHIAVAQGAVGAARRLVGLFLQGGRELDVYNRLRQTPLHLAVITGQPGLVRLLVAHGASPMALDRLGRTAAHLACESRSPRCLRELLRPGPHGGPDLQARNYEGLTPLHVAVSSGARDSVLLLLEHGADVDAVDIKSGRSPLLHAVESNSLEMAELLIQVIDILRGKASRPPASSSPPPLPDGPPQAPNGPSSPGSPRSPPRSPTAANQRADSAEPANRVQGLGPCLGVKHEGGGGQPMGCAGGPALALPLADSHLDPACLYPMVSPGREAAANPLAPRPFHQPIVSLGPPANQGPGRAAQMDQSWTLAEGNKPAPEAPRLRAREGRGQAGGGR